MRHLYRLIAIVSFAICSACSDYKDSETTTYHVQAKAYLEEVVRTTIIDNVEANSAKVLWEATDQIGVAATTSNTISTLELTDGAGSSSASFEGDITTDDPAAENFYAFYPALNSATLNNGQLTLTLPTEQQNIAAGIDGAAYGFMVAKSSNTAIDKLSFAFENLFAVLRLPITGNGEQLTQISFMGGNNEITSGAFTIDLTSPNYDITFSDNGSNQTNLLTDATLTAEAQLFYLVVPAIDYTSGYSIRITTTDGQTMQRSVGHDGGRTLKRGVIYKLPELSFETQSADLSANGKANCYIVSAAGNYCFDCDLTNGATAEIVWQDSDGLISNIELAADGYVHFKASATEGNALLAVRDASNTIIGSWHIWSTDAPQSQTYDDGTVVLDRNLGALSPEGVGLYYQWGRRTPFTATPQTTETGDLASAINNPALFYTKWSSLDVPNDSWGNATTSTYSSNAGTKTANDPCPAGWRVAPPILFRNLLNVLDKTTTPYTAKFENGTTAYYPFTNRLNTSGELSNSSCGYLWTNSNYITSSSTSVYGTMFQYSNSNTTSFAGNGSKIYQIKTYGHNVRCVAE